MNPASLPTSSQIQRETRKCRTPQNRAKNHRQKSTLPPDKPHRRRSPTARIPELGPAPASGWWPGGRRHRDSRVGCGFQCRGRAVRCAAAGHATAGVGEGCRRHRRRRTDFSSLRRREENEGGDGNRTLAVERCVRGGAFEASPVCGRTVEAG